MEFIVVNAFFFYLNRERELGYKGFIIIERVIIGVDITFRIFLINNYF